MKFKPYKAIVIKQGRAYVKGAHLQIKDVLLYLADGKSMQDMADDWGVGVKDISDSLKELSCNLIAETPMKISLTIETPKGPVEVEDFVYGTPVLGDMVNISTALWKKLMSGTELSPYSFWIKEVGPKKIQLIKLMRELTGSGLKEAKELVESAPFLIPLNKIAAKQDFTEIAKRLNEAGAVYELLGQNETDVHKILNQ